MILKIVVVALATYRASVLIADDGIMDWLRGIAFRYAHKTQHWKAYTWVQCKRCNGAWFTVLFWLLYSLEPTLVQIVAAMGIQALLVSVIAEKETA